MTTPPDILFQSIPSNKFYPPRINRSQSIPRHTIITRQLGDNLPSRLFIIIEAQAGQGKTTLVQQFLEHSQHPSVWYQVGPEDHDPLLLLSALQLALSRIIPGCSSTRLSAILANPQISTLELQHFANILFNDLATLLVEDTFIVFDDLHLLSEAPQSRHLLDYLIDTAPPLLHFILTSRNPLQLGARSLRSSPHLVYLDTDDLALSPAEIETLYDRLLSTTISRTEAVEICAITSGWIMGIILAAHPCARKNGACCRKRPGDGGSRLFNKGTNNYLLAYFEEEIFFHIPESLRETLQMLSFLDDIDTHLAGNLTPVDNLAHLLGDLADRNLFVYRLDDENRLFRFHHLFQEFLQVSGKKSLDPVVISRIYRRAAAHYLDQGQFDKAIKTMQLSGDFRSMEQLMQRHGPQLLSINRSGSLLAILQLIPEEILAGHPWLTFYCGLLAIDSTPRQTLPLFTSCRTQFAESGNEVGELMALTQIIHYHFAISGAHRDGAELLGRTRDLYERNRHRLPGEIALLSARNLAAGLSLFAGDISAARSYAQQALALVTTQPSNNFVAATRFICGYINLLCGERRAARLEIEKSFALCRDPLVGTNNRLSLIFLHLFELSLHGDLAAFLRTRDLVLTSFDQTLVGQTVAAPYLSLWSAIIRIADGQIAAAHDLLEQGLQVTQTVTNAHMLSQFFQWRGFTQALLGNEMAALDDLEESKRLREMAGGPFHTACYMAISGATLALLNRYDEAAESLKEARDLSNRIPSMGITLCCLAYQALIALATDNQEDSAEHLSSWLTSMNRHGYRCFWGWEPVTMSRLLRAAVRMGIEPTTARRLARHRLEAAVDDNGDLIPLLSINMLGAFSLASEDRTLFGPQDLTFHQRELFGLIIATPGQRISQELIQLSFWPDSPPDKARKSFDTLMTRLRKTLSQKLPAPVQNYIGVEKGFVHLNRVSIDAVNFLQCARHGLKRAKQGQWWQAGNLFAKALSQWAAFRPIDSFTSDQALGFSEEVVTVLRTVTLVWSSKLVALNRAEEALDILDQTNKILPIDEDFVLLRYQLFLQQHQPLKARDILTTYHQELVQLGWSPEEAEELVISLTGRAARNR
jgi:LuxR family transcriptional regulator, maltose regulon positive regulatory protein